MGKNFRDTKQRLAIRQVLARHQEPMSPQAILDEASKLTESLGIATVYRYLRRMVTEGQVEQIELPGVKTCYMIPRTRQEPFLIDERRQRIRRLPNVALDLPEKSLPPGFRVTRFEVLVFGEFAEDDPPPLTTAEDPPDIPPEAPSEGPSEGPSGQP